MTAFIGPSGCGKSTVLRTLNRMHEVIAGARVEGKVLLDGEDIYGPDIDPVDVRRTIGMVFQRPNPFPTMSIYDNVVAGLQAQSGRIARSPTWTSVVEKSLRGANLWEEVKDRLNKPGAGLSGGQQQRLCIARAIAVEPQVLLMDEPCSALDPISTLAIEDLIAELKEQYTIVIVTHNMQQAARVSRRTAFFNLAGDRQAGQAGRDGRHRRRSSPTRPTSAPRTTSPAASADPGPAPAAEQANLAHTGGVASREQPVLVTTAGRSPGQDRRDRERRYLITMGIRVIAFIVALVVAHGWVRVSSRSSPRWCCRGLRW